MCGCYVLDTLFSNRKWLASISGTVRVRHLCFWGDLAFHQQTAWVRRSRHVGDRCLKNRCRSNKFSRSTPAIMPGLSNNWYNRRMALNLQIDVGSLDASHRRALEEVIGRELDASERLTISVSDPAVPPPVTIPAQSLEDWTAVYEGLSDNEVNEIDTLIKTRANLTRPLP